VARAAIDLRPRSDRPAPKKVRTTKYRPARTGLRRIGEHGLALSMVSQCLTTRHP
jgi:hypothetical protein